MTFINFCGELLPIQRVTYVGFCSVVFFCVAILCVMAVALSLYPFSADMSVSAQIFCVGLCVCAFCV